MRKLFFLWSLKVSLLVDENSEFQLHFQFLEPDLVELVCQFLVVKNHEEYHCHLELVIEIRVLRIWGGFFFKTPLILLPTLFASINFHTPIEKT